MCRSPSTRAALKARCDGFPTAMYNTSTLHPSQLNSSWRSWRSSSMKKTSGLCFVMLLPCHPGRSVLGIWIELGWCTTKKSACATWCHGRKFSNSAAKKMCRSTKSKRAPGLHARTPHSPSCFLGVLNGQTESTGRMAVESAAWGRSENRYAPGSRTQSWDCWHDVCWDPGLRKIRSLSCLNYITIYSDIYGNSRNSCQILAVTASWKSSLLFLWGPLNHPSEPHHQGWRRSAALFSSWTRKSSEIIRNRCFISSVHSQSQHEAPQVKDQEPASSLVSGNQSENATWNLLLFFVENLLHTQSSGFHILWQRRLQQQTFFSASSSLNHFQHSSATHAKPFALGTLAKYRCIQPYSKNIYISFI